MGMADVFGADTRVEIKVNDLLRYFDRYAKGEAEAEILKKGITAGVPVEYLKGVITGEPVEIEEILPCCYVDKPEEEVLFISEDDMFLNAANGNYFGLTDHGYDCTPDKVKPEREVGKPVKGFERKVPVSWVEKGYVVEMAECLKGEADQSEL